MKKILLLLIILLVGCSNSNNINSDKLINEILSYNELGSEIDYNFLNYIYTNYSIDSLLELKKVLDNNQYDNKVWHTITGNSLNVLKDYYQDKYTNKDNVKLINTKRDITINFVGDVSLADNWHIMPSYDKRNKGIYGILDEDIVNILNESTLSVANNEFSISTRGTPLVGKAFTFRANPSRINIYKEMGIDLVSLANNHVYDYGLDAFLDTIDSLNKENIANVGAGRNIEEATKPFYYIINGYKFAFISASRAEKHLFTKEATIDSPGILMCYDPEILLDTIKKVENESDYVILLVHWGRESSNELEEVIIETGREYIDAGVDLIVGSHAHVLQGMEIYKDKLIAYNLGNFIFNKKEIDTAILNLKVDSDGNLSYKFIPCLQKDTRTMLLKDNEKSRVIEFMNKISSNKIINSNGDILLGGYNEKENNNNN